MLGAALKERAPADPIVLAIPRGGVEVGAEVARVLAAPLDIVIVHKLGAPGHGELAIGAVTGSDPPRVLLNKDMVAKIGVPAEYIREETARQVEEIRRRERAYRHGRPRAPVAGRTAIVVDDGIATGATVRAALAAVREEGPARLILGVPVASRQAVAMLSGECDELVCLETPEPFVAVGMHYRRFGQTDDDRVVELLDQAAGGRGTDGADG
jgi:putative phosphoribosyl transferase